MPSLGVRSPCLMSLKQYLDRVQDRHSRFLAGKIASVAAHCQGAAAATGVLPPCTIPQNPGKIVVLPLVAALGCNQMLLAAWKNAKETDTENSFSIHFRGFVITVNSNRSR
jgi:hypothetical protein